MIVNEIFIKSLKGVGDVSIKFAPDSRLRVLIGANGIGKTKSLEAIFQALFFSNEIVGQVNQLVSDELFQFSSVRLNEDNINAPKNASLAKDWLASTHAKIHALPVLYLGSQNRGMVTSDDNTISPIGTFEERRSDYVKSVIRGMQASFESLNMDTPIENWFTTLANSANPYQKKEDNRGFEMKTVLSVLNRIDSRIDDEFIEITGGGKVNIMIDQVKRDITRLSSGFSAILKMTQAIVSGYGNFSNDLNLERVKGYVLIDEIDSHLHPGWQTKIIPLLSQIFPNTIFIVTTHSPLVCSELDNGQVYQLDRDSGGVVNSREIALPKSAMLIDTIRDGFGIDLNRNKLDNFDWELNKNAKNDLLNLINDVEGK